MTTKIREKIFIPWLKCMNFAQLVSFSLFKLLTYNSSLIFRNDYAFQFTVQSHTLLTRKIDMGLALISFQVRT
jgi:hypothetical protein